MQTQENYRLKRLFNGQHKGFRQKRDKKNNNNMDDDVKVLNGGDDGGGIGCCGVILLIFSWILVICTFPLSLLVCLKMVQEYERAVIFRVGRLLDGGAKGFI